MSRPRAHNDVRLHLHCGEASRLLSFQSWESLAEKVFVVLHATPTLYALRINRKAACVSAVSTQVTLYLTSFSRSLQSMSGERIPESDRSPVPCAFVVELYVPMYSFSKSIDRRPEQASPRGLCLTRGLSLDNGGAVLDALARGDDIAYAVLLSIFYRHGYRS
ncbi:hypothetical protein Tco_0695018 [Tanacetum coccineum]